MADGKITFDTAVDNSGLKSGLNQSKSMASAFKGTVAKLGKAAIAAVSIGAIVNFGKKAIELGSNVAEVQNVVDTAFGNMSYKIEEFAGSAVQNFGMSQLSAKKTASTYMAMAKSMGLEEGAASDMAISLTGLTGDVASFYNISQELADTKLKSVFTGETETLKELGVVMTQTNLNAFAMANGYGKTIDKMTQAEAVQLRYAYVTNQLRLASGDFVKTQDSWANQTRILSEQWKELMSVIGQGLITVLAPLVKTLNTIVSYLIKVATAATSAMEALFGKQPKNTAAGKIASDTAAAVENQEALTAATNETGKAAKNASLGMDELNVISQEESGNGGSASSGGGNTTGTYTLDVETNEEKENEFLIHFQSFTERIKSLIEPLKNIDFSPAVGAFGRFGEAAKKCGLQVLDGLEWSWTNLLVPFGKWCVEEAGPASIDIFTGALDALNSVIEALRPFGEWLWDNFLQPIAEWTGGVIVDTLKKIGDGLEKFSNWIDENQPLVETIAIIIGSFAAAIGLVNLAMGIWNGLVIAWNVISAIASNATLIFGAAMNFLTSPVTLITLAIGALIAIVVLLVKNWDKVKEVAGNVWKGIKDIWGKVADWFKTKILDPISNVFKKVVNGIIGFINGMISGIIDGVNFILKAMNKISFDIPDWVPGIGGKTFGFKFNMLTAPQIPKLAQGAVIPPNREFLAVLGDQKSGTNIETPLDTMIQAFKTALADGGYAGGETVVNLTAMLDGDVIYRNQERIRQLRGTKTVLTGTFAR